MRVMSLLLAVRRVGVFGEWKVKELVGGLRRLSTVIDWRWNGCVGCEGLWA